MQCTPECAAANSKVATICGTQMLYVHCIHEKGYHILNQMHCLSSFDSIANANRLIYDVPGREGAIYEFIKKLIMPKVKAARDGDIFYHAHAN